MAAFEESRKAVSKREEQSFDGHPPRAWGLLPGAPAALVVATRSDIVEPDGVLRLPPNEIPCQTTARRSRSALPITDTELSDIAAAANIGLSRSPDAG